MHAVDLWLLDAVQAIQAQWLDVLGSLVGLFGLAEVTAGIALGLAVARWRAHRRDAVVPLFIAVVVVAETLVRILVAQPAPPPESAHTVQLLPSLHVPFANSFPSGHVARSAFLLGIANGIPVWAVAAGVVLMALTRIYLGEHWLSDTIGGAILGLGVAQLARRVN